LSGSVKAVIPVQDNPRYELYTLSSGDFFGEEIIFSSEPRENSIIVKDHLFALTIDENSLRKIIDVSEKSRYLLDKKYIERKLRRDLRSVPVFNRLNNELFQEVLESAELLNLDQSRIIFHEGTTGDSFYLLRSGEVNVFRDYNGRSIHIDILGEGQFFGEMALLSDEKRNATIETAMECKLVKISRSDFLEIVGKDPGIIDSLNDVVNERIKHRNTVKDRTDTALVTRRMLDLNREVNSHLDVISNCTVDTELGSALLATLPGSRYPYVYPRDSACASRLLYRIVNSPLKSGKTALRLLGEIARFILNCQRNDGYWGQRYGINGEDKGIYRQEDNVAHGVIILCRYLLAAAKKDIQVSDFDKMIKAISLGTEFARKNYYRKEIHLFYSTTSIHESAIEEGYSIWVNYAYLMMLRLIEMIGMQYDILSQFSDEMILKKSFENTIDNVFSMSGRYVRRLKPDGIMDLRPDITLMSPFFFSTGMDINFFNNNDLFKNSVEYIIDTLWDPELGMLQRYLPFIEDPETHIHAGNGPWIQYTAILAQYYFCNGKIKKGNEILDIIKKYKSREGYLCEHLTTPERFYEFNTLEWITGRDYEKEFDPGILISGISYDNIVEELNHMKNAYNEVNNQCKKNDGHGYISFASPLMWSHVEYTMAIIMRTEEELAGFSDQWYI